ncbi:AAA family ATPase [Actinopolymorpha sp. NPDC004070]|uniref:AAA family ATPase n=1 Tax=Actinopolymorpha sp. NPDC004070 TaxID=3154548 RepID=UPI0033BD778B
MGGRGLDLRFAERRKWFRQLERRSYATSLSVAKFTSSSGELLNLEFTPGLHVISGGNGAGKSTTLGALSRCLGVSTNRERDQFSLPSVPAWLAKLEVSGTHNDTQWSAAMDFVAPELVGDCPAPTFYVNPSSETEQILLQFKEDDSPGDLTEGVDPAPFSEDACQLVSYLLRRNYSSIETYEVTAYSEEDDPVPFFVVSSMGRTYDLMGMGRGELSAIYLVWRLNQIPAGSVVLLEEPESHLAVFSQDALVDTLVKIVIDQNLAVVASSHSPGFFERLPNGSVTMLSALPQPAISSGLSTAAVARHLGIPSRGETICLITEDRLAAEMLRAVLARFDEELLSHTMIWYANSGMSGVRRIADELKAVQGARHQVVGILDGDQRSVAGDKFGYLIGDGAPEVVIRGEFDNWRSGAIQNWSPLLPGGAENLIRALERADGSDGHDWFEAVAKECGGLQVFMSACLDLMCRNEELESQAAVLVSWIRSRHRVADV